MKKALALLLALVMCLSLAACGGESQEIIETEAPQTSEIETTAPQITTYKIGDTVSTDILEFTLDSATLAIALSNVLDDTYCEPKEYNPQDDANNPLVCGKGHTYAAFTYTVSNLDRTSYNGKLPFISAEYKGVISNKQVDGAEFAADKNEWITTGNNPTSPVYSWYFVLSVGEERTFRSFIDVPIEADSLSDEFSLIIDLPSSDGFTSFTFIIPKQ